MRTALSKVRAEINAKLGRCAVCMRQCFVAAVSAWAVSLALWLVIAIHLIADVALVAATCLTVLWIAHLVAYASRMAAASEGHVTSAHKISRREAIPTFARAFGAIALSTALPVCAAAAQSCCDCSKCNSNQVCCNTANGCCGCFPAAIKCPS